MREVMEYELETKKKHLSKLQDYFRIDIKDIASPKYEDNAINALLEMKKVKTEIEQLEYYLQLKTWFYWSGMRDVHDLINREVMVDGKEGEITNILGVMYEITFFNLNDGKTIVDIKDIDKYLV